jgi:hypothetical protein
VREGTLAVEFPETLEDRVLTRAGVQYIEGWVGYSTGAEDLHAALQAITPANA